MKSALMVLLFCLVAVTVFGAEPVGPVKFEMVLEGKSPYPLADRKNLSLNCGGGKGVLISPRWVMTASHCITSRKQKAGQVQVSFPGANR